MFVARYLQNKSIFIYLSEKYFVLYKLMRLKTLLNLRYFG